MASLHAVHEGWAWSLFQKAWFVQVTRYDCLVITWVCFDRCNLLSFLWAVTSRNRVVRCPDNTMKFIPWALSGATGRHFLLTVLSHSSGEAQSVSEVWKHGGKPSVIIWFPYAAAKKGEKKLHHTPKWLNSMVTYFSNVWKHKMTS